MIVARILVIGEEEKAREMFAKVIKWSNPHGLFSEGIETDTGRLVGNFPQGYSHLALIQTVLLLETDYNWTEPLVMDGKTGSYTGIFRHEK